MSLLWAGLVSWAVMGAGLSLYLVYPPGGQVSGTPEVLIAAVASASGPVTEEPGVYVTAVVKDEDGREVGRFALHDDGQTADARAGDGLWACEATTLSLPPGRYSVALACQYQGRKFWSPQPAALTVVLAGGKRQAGTPWSWWAGLVLLLLASTAGAALAYRAWLGVRALRPGEVPTEDRVWGELFQVANGLGGLVEAAHQQARSESSLLAGVAQHLADALSRCSAVEQAQKVKLGFVSAVLAEGLEALGYERIEPERGQVPPRNCETVAVETTQVPPGTVAEVLRPGWQKRRGESIEVLQPALVAVARSSERISSQGDSEE